MAEGTNVGSIFLDLIVRDTVQKQTERIAAKAQASAQRAFTGMENAITGTFNKAVASAQAKVNDLARQMERVTEKFNDAKLSGNDTAAQKWGEHRERVYERLEAAREKLTIEITAAAQREAAAEERAAQKAAAVDQREAHRRKAIHESMWKNMLSTAGNASKAISNKASGITKGFGKASKTASYFGSRLKGIVTSALIFNGISAGLRKLTDYLGKTISSTDEMKQALANLKGAAATAAAPLIQAITPDIVALTNAAATAFHYLSKLISLFTGKSVQSMANAAKKINKSTKDATRSLADFDEIQKLGDNSSKSAEPNYNYQAESTFLEAAVKKIQQLVAPLQKINFSPLIASLGKLGKSFLKFGATVAKALEWAWYKILVPLAEWTIEAAAPAALDVLSSAFDALNEALGPVTDGLAKLWEDLDPFVVFVEDTVIQALASLRGMFDELANTISDRGEEIRGIFSGIGEIFDIVWRGMEPILTAMRTKWRDTFDAISSYVVDELGFIIDGLSGLVDFIAGVLTGDWERAWEGFVEVVKAPLNSLIGFVNTMISAVVAGVNAIIDMVNTLSFDIPDWEIFGEYAGEKFGFDFEKVIPPQIPYLADGGVIRQPTLAMMGEYPGANSNPEIVAPQSMIAETVASVIAGLIESNAQGFEDVVQAIREKDTSVQLDGDVLGRAISGYNSKMAVIHGGYY